MGSYFFLGLDLGQAQDYTAFAIAEKVMPPKPEIGEPVDPDRLPTYHVRELGRFDLGTAYPTMVAYVAGLARRAPLAGSTVMAVDQTGVGRPVVDLLRRERMQLMGFYPVTITGGNKATSEGGSWHVPKRDLVSVVKVLQQSKRLKVAPQLPHAKTLVDELLAFQVKITDAANDTYGAWREGAHDDLVLATALACWTGERLAPVQRLPNTPYSIGSRKVEDDDGWPFGRAASGRGYWGRR